MKTWMTLLTASIISLGIAHAATAQSSTAQSNTDQINNTSPAALNSQTTQGIESVLKTKLIKDFPQLNIKSVSKTEMPGIYEVYTNQRIVYTNAEGKYFLVGNLIDLAAQKNMTEQREQTLTAIDVKQLPLKQAIKYVKGKGERTLYVFSDPDCPFCHKLDAELAKLDNVRIYTFMFPLVQLHPEATEIAQRVWCSKDQYTAWTDYTLKQKKPTATADCKNPVAQNIALAKTLDITSTPTVFLSNGHRISGVKAAAELDLLMNEAAQK